MSFDDCVMKAVASGEIDEETAGSALEWYQRYKKKYDATGEPDAGMRAATEAAEKSTLEAKKRAQQKYLKFKTSKQLFEQIRDYRTPGKGRQKPHEAGYAVLDSTGLSGVPGVKQIHEEYNKRAHSMLAGFMGEQRKNIIGNSRDEVQLQNVVREIFGEDTGDAAAKAHAKAWNETAEWLRAEFNRGGGDIAFRKDWGLPQMHDWQALSNAYFPTWREFTYDLLDVAKMSEQYGMTPAEIFESLKSVFDNISSNGTKQIDFDAMGFKKSTANTRMDSRFLVFKDADSWMKYQDKFGNGDPYSVMMSHIDLMARDIAMMKKLGPNPRSGLDLVKQTVKKYETELGGRNNYDEPLQDIFDVLTGEANMPVISKLAKTGANVRQTLTAAQLGSAVVSAVTDPFWMSMTSSFNGMKSAKVIGRVMKSLNTADHEQFLRLGLSAESWADAAADLARYHNEAVSSPFFQKLSSGVLRASGLNYWTDLWRWSFEREMLGFITDNTKHPFNKIDTKLQKALKRYGISADEWDIIRATPQYEIGEGVKYLRTQDIARRKDLSGQQADDLSLKLAGFISNETNFAIPTGSLRGKRMLGALGKPGTPWGEIMRSGMMYKNFPLTIIMTHLRRSFDEMAQGRAGYLTTVLVGTTVMGGLALQLKALKDGKNPDDTSSADFWTRAFLQGGGLGIYGDFIIQDHNRYGGGPQETIAGPAVGAGHDAARIAQYLLFETGKDGEYEDGEQARNMFKALERASNYVPGRSIWYLSAAYKRAFQDNLKAMGNKNPRRKLKRIVKDRRKRNNSDYWWQPGDATPF
ncbi:MAG: hypothetical protein DHS20C08_04730 [Rhodomicrobium sp.]|nr:MAG: hypothetical protein DHS20C08_04730 [Rhodomicrobium sp.]